MPETLTIDFAKPIPVFPLASCVLLPHATVPLHVFEPRYRTMTREALDSNGLIAMATFQGDGWKQDYLGRPPLREHVCIGYIVQHQQFQDGRYNILLQGICRAKIVRELEHDPYRLAILEPTETDAPMEIDLSEHRQRIEALLADPLLAQLAAVKAVHDWLSSEVPTAAAIDLAVLATCHDVEKRYAMLEETNIYKRAEWLEQYLRQTRRTVQIAERFGSGVSEDGLPLN